MENLKREKQKIVTDRRIVLLGIILAVCCLTAGLYWKYRYRLKEPVFVETNQAVSFYYGQHGSTDGGYANVIFYYITGKEDQRVVSRMEFLQLGETGEDGFGDGAKGPRAVLEEPQEMIEADSQYVLHTLGGRLYVEGAPEEYEGTVLTEAKVFYTDGTTAVQPIGAIVCMPKESFPELLPETLSASSSSAGWNREEIRIRSDAVLRPLGILAEERIRGNFEITVGGVSYEKLLEEGGFPLKTGETLEIKAQWNETNPVPFPTDTISELVFFELSGKEKQYLCFEPMYTQQSGRSFLRTWKYLNERGAFSDGGQK